jgi:hypothetical protein
MKKVFIFFIVLNFYACALQEEKLGAEEEFGISFTLNEVDYFVTDYIVKIDPTNEWNRIVSMNFDNNSKTFLFHVEVEETNEIGLFVLQDEIGNWISNPGVGDRETSIVIHTDTNMKGTFRVTIQDNLDNSKYKITNGKINIQY